ncbi:hypothetical protein Ancab_018894 [Ancistrocladus abbreviatus]
MLHGSFTSFLKFPYPVETLWLEMQKKGIPLHIWSDEFFISLARRWGKLIDINRETSQRKSFAMAHFAIQTQMLEVIQMKECIKVEEDELLVTVAEETVGAADRMRNFERDTGGNPNTDSSLSLLLSIVPDSFGQANADDHIPGVDLPS